MGHVRIVYEYLSGIRMIMGYVTNEEVPNLPLTVPDPLCMIVARHPRWVHYREVTVLPKLGGSRPTSDPPSDPPVTAPHLAS